MSKDIINNIDVDKLPDFVQDSLIGEFIQLSTKHKLIIYAKLIHGNLFKVTSNDLFNINKQLPGIVYRQFIKALEADLVGNNE